MATYSLRDIAQRIGEADGLNAKGVDDLHNQLRGLYQRGLLTPTDRGSRDAALFDEKGLCAARLLTTLAAFTIEIVPLLREAETAAAFAGQRPARQKLRPGKREKVFGLDAAVAGVREGDDWTFRLELRRNAGTGEKRLVGIFERDADREAMKPDPTAAKILSTYRQTKGEEEDVLGSTEIPLLPLFSPLLAGDDKD